MKDKKLYIVGLMFVTALISQNASHAHKIEKKVETKKAAQHCGPFDPRCHHNNKPKD